MKRDLSFFAVMILGLLWAFPPVSRTAPGDDCTDPITVSAPTDLPYSDLGQTSCGRDDAYDSTCLGYYDGGEDIIYELIVTTGVCVNVTLDPNGATWTGIALDYQCPAGQDSCIAVSTNSSGSPHGFAGIHLDPGTYYIMIDTWPDPECIPDFDLTIISANHAPVLAAIGNQKFNEGDYVALNISAFDVDGDSLIFTASNLPDGAHFYGGDAVFLWTPTYAQRGTYPNIHFEVSDGQGGTDSEDIMIEILNYPQGDVVENGIVDVGDVMYLLNYLFIEGPPPEPLESGDVTCNGEVDIGDVLHLINYLFIEGPPACAPPSPRFILPASDGIYNGLVWVAAENLSDTPVQEVEFQYSADSLIWEELVFDESEPPRAYDLDFLTRKTYQGFWNTESLSSGQYWLRVIMRDTVHSAEGSEAIPVLIDKNPTPVISVSYDTATGTVTFDASSSYDPEGSVIRWEWIFCDTSTYQDSVIQKAFVPGDSCQVNLTVYDDVYNHSTSYNMLIADEYYVSFDSLSHCTCIEIDVQETDEIPKKSSLDFGKTIRKNPKGGKKLGPIDHHEKDSAGNDISPGYIKLYFMVKALVVGNPEACSTMQYTNATFLFDGPGGPGPNGMIPDHYDGKPFDPADPNDPKNPPAKAADLDPDDYNTDCTPLADRPPKKKHVFEKISIKASAPDGLLFGLIRWIDAPGNAPKAPLTLDKYKEVVLKANGAHMFMFHQFEVVNYPDCKTGRKRCIVWKAKYDKDGNRQDVTGDGNPDPPTITDPDAACP